MAKMWPVYQGNGPTHGEPWAEMPLADAVRVLELDPEDIAAPISDPPRFGELDHDLTWMGYRHVIVEVTEGEANQSWPAGFYKTRLTPAEAAFRLRVHRSLGEAWRDEWGKGVDSEGEPAIWLWVYLKPDAPRSEWDFRNRQEILNTVQQIWNKAGLADWTYVRFRQDGEAVAS
jgi:hypothetical protein